MAKSEIIEPEGTEAGPDWLPSHREINLSKDPLRIIDSKDISEYLRGIKRTKNLTLEEEGNLAARIRHGDKNALKILVRANLKFVVSVCRNYENQGLPLEVLINEGNLGLIRAAKRFDETKHFKFISYAVWWIRQAILSALAEQAFLRNPQLSSRNPHAPSQSAIHKGSRQVNVLGQSVGMKTENKSSIIEALKSGFPFSSFTMLQRNMDVPAGQLASTVNIAPRTISRRQRQGRLQPDESERVLRVGRLFDLAFQLFEDKKKAQVWFKSPNRALGGKSPLEYVDTEPGAKEVENLIGRLEHGIFS